MKITRHTLSNGIRTVIVEMPDREVVATSVYVGAGGRYETPDTYGISHFLEHMLFRGTKKYPTGEIFDNLIESVGGIANASTGADRTNYYNIMPKDHMLVGFDALSEQISRSIMGEEEVEKQRGIITEEINRAYGIPENFIWRKFKQLAWPGQPIESDVLGPKENILRFQKKELVSYMRSHYSAKNMVICVAGEIKSKEVISDLETYFGAVKEGKRVIPKTINSNQDKSRTMVCEKEIDQAHIALGYKSLPLSDDRKFTLDVLMAILGGGSGSILYKEIRGKHGLAYFIGGGVSYYADAGFANVYAGLSKEKVTEALKVIKSELYKSKDSLFSEEEIKRAKELLKGRNSMRLDGTLNTCLKYGEMELLDPRKLDQKETAEMIDKVTAEEIREVANFVFQDNKENLVVIGPYKSDKKFKEALKNY